MQLHISIENPNYRRKSLIYDGDCMQQENSDSCSFTGSAAVNDTDDNEPESLNKADFVLTITEMYAIIKIKIEINH